MMLPAPCLFSTTTGWPSRSPSGAAMMRVMMSVPPPGPAPTITWIGRVGHPCAPAPPSTESTKSAAARNVRIKLMESSGDVMGGYVPSPLILDRVAQNSNALDLDLAGIAVLHPDRMGLACVANAGRRAGEDDVTWLERKALRDVDQHLAHREHHVLGIVRLHDRAVEPALDLEARGVRWQLVRRHHPGPESAGAVEILAHVPLRGLALEFAHRAFVRARPSRDARGRIVHGEVLRGLADDQRQLGLVVERLRHLGPDDRALVRHHRGEAAHEDGGEFRDVVAIGAFLDVIEIVEAEA